MRLSSAQSVTRRNGTPKDPVTSENGGWPRKLATSDPCQHPANNLQRLGRGTRPIYQSTHTASPMWGIHENCEVYRRELRLRCKTTEGHLIFEAEDTVLDSHASKSLKVSGICQGTFRARPIRWAIGSGFPRRAAAFGFFGLHILCRHDRQECVSLGHSSSGLPPSRRPLALKIPWAF